ncbi:hypothetical protein ACEYW6_36945 [Nostoc sp. UIC 10607]|uniref:hypothetical protein n=1 Tax=Nostoc sp. UIC 10607 TaxID=3045935 RepID=UPI0039A11686
MRNLSGDKGTILVVDDEASIRRILQTRLVVCQGNFALWSAEERRGRGERT